MCKTTVWLWVIISLSVLYLQGRSLTKLLGIQFSHQSRIPNSAASTNNVIAMFEATRLLRKHANSFKQFLWPNCWITIRNPQSGCCILCILMTWNTFAKASAKVGPQLGHIKWVHFHPCILSLCICVTSSWKNGDENECLTKNQQDIANLMADQR